MPKLNSLPTFSLVIETANLATSDLAHLDRSLKSLMRQQLDLDKANEVIVVDTGLVPVQELERVCSVYKKIVVHRPDHPTDYYGAKTAGLPFVTGEIVVFADSDCEYEPTWLTQLLQPFDDPNVQIVVGETWHRIRNPYDLGVALAWVCEPFSRGEGLSATHNYCANNMAARREVICEIPFVSSDRELRNGQAHHIYALRQKGYTLWQQPKARAYHKLLGLDYVFKRMWLQGQEVRLITNYGVNPLGTNGLWRLRLSRFRDKVALALKEDWRYFFYLPLALPVITVLALLYALGYLSPLRKSTLPGAFLTSGRS